MASVRAHFAHPGELHERIADMDEERNVLVTGAGRRIGRAIAVDLARDGWGVAVHYNRSKQEAEAVVAEIEAIGGRAIALHADLGPEAAVTQLVPQAVDRIGPLWALVNNASVFERDDAMDANPQSWSQNLEVNLRAPFVLIQGFARQLLPSRHGSVVNMIDERVWNLTPHFISYTVSKSALWTLTQTLAVALAPTVRINAVGPGAALASDFETSEMFQRLGAALPRGRVTGPQEICDAVRFLLRSSAVTGQMVAVDGGKHLGWLLPGQVASEAIV
jgi:NAD(P)-dependent dehydrogenase (short-subunit alcohol dehydrogenase family)